MDYNRLRNRQFDDNSYLPKDSFLTEENYGTSSGFPSTSSDKPPNFLPISNAANQDPLAGAVLGLSDVITKALITHPCSVIRRQCQVHQFAKSLHITPFTLVPVIGNAVAKEGVQTFWKGSIGNGVVWALANVTEIVIGDLFGFPRTYVVNGSTEKYWRHIALKAATFFVMTPFYVSSFIGTVRSESAFGGDDNLIMDVITKGVDRMRFAIFSARDPSRRFSVLHLAIPTVTFRTSQYILQAALYDQFYKMAKKYVHRKPESERTKFHEYLPQIFAQMSSSVLTDLILFPVETVLHRLYIQGTRTLIDNMDNGVSAVSMSVKYSGFFDCVKQIIEAEGVTALYAGVGALALEYMLHSGLQQLVRACFDRGSEMLRKATEGHPKPANPLTPPLSSKGAFNNGPLSNIGSKSGAFVPTISPIGTPKKTMNKVASPPRDPTQYPTFGETISQFGSSYTPPPQEFGASSTRPNIFGSPPNRPRAYDQSSPPVVNPQSLNETSVPLAPLRIDSDPFSG